MFNPTNFDPDQWVGAAESFGAKGLILVAKHHDGFCLWPSAFTEYSVKNSSWRDGEGDVVKEVAQACRRGGIKFGVYLSPSDRNHPSYGRDSEAYNDYFCNQLRELLTNYGPISQVFFDGASAVNRKQDYDWQRYYRLIRELQPEAVISIRGPDVRWVGNESGVARPSEWSVIPLPVPPEEYDWKDMTEADLGSREKVENAKYLHWYPAVATVSLRPNWFWKPNTEISIKSLRELQRIYELSVGRNAVLQLGIAPDQTGRIPEPDVKRLKEFGDFIRNSFSTNLCLEPGTEIVNEDLKWNEFFKQTIKFPEPQFVRYVVLQEDISKGQHVEKFKVRLTTTAGRTRELEATTVGYKRILRVQTPEVREIQVIVSDSRATPHLTVAAY